MLTLIFSLWTMLPAQAATAMELQWALCGQTGREVLELLQAEAPEQKDSKITYFERQPIQYLEQGLSFRRKETRKKDKFVVKARFSSEKEAPEGVDCEWDRHGKDQRFTCAIESEGGGWTKEQRQLAESVADVKWASLRSYGPFQVRRWQWKSDFSDAPFSLEQLDGEGMRPILELSLRVTASKGSGTYSEVSRWLKQRGVGLCPSQDGKEERALSEY